MVDRAFSWFECRWAAPIYDAILPPAAATRARHRSFWASVLRTAPAGVVAVNVAAVVAIAFLPPFLIGRFATFRLLETREQQLCLERLQSHKVYALRLILNVAKYSALLAALSARSPDEAGQHT